MPTRFSAAVAGFLFLAACREQAPPRIPEGRLVRTEGGAARSLLALEPEQCRIGEVFRRQPNGQAELLVVGTGLTGGDAIFWNGHSLKTNFSSSRILSGDVPSALLESPGEVEVTVENTLDPTRSKLRARFVIGPLR